MSEIETKWIEDAAITAIKIADNAVVSAKIQDNAVVTSKINDAAVIASKIASDAVITVKILDSNVTTSKINDAAVVAAKLASDSVVTIKILDANVTNAKIANLAIDNSKVSATAAIVESKLSLNFSTSSLNSDIQTRELAANKGIAGGYASLDGGGKVPISQLSTDIMQYKGSFNPTSTTIVDGVGNAGDVYRANVAGSVNFGSGLQAYGIGDLAIYSGSIWEHSPADDAVLSVNGNTGVVILDTDDISEGVTNLYFTTARARTAVVDDAIVNGVVDKAPSQNAVFDALALKANDAVVVKSVNSITPTAGDVALNSDTIPEGSTNLYFTDTRARTAAVADAIVDGVTNVAASQNAVFDALALKVPTSRTVNGHALSADVTVTKGDVGLGNVDNLQQIPMSYLDTDGTLAANSDVKVASQKAVKTYVTTSIAAIPASASPRREIFTLSGTNISNGYLDLAFAANTSAGIMVIPVKGIPQEFGVDFTVGLTSGVAGVTRITFAGDLSTNAIAGDHIVVHYFA